jgi:dihydroxyacetone kinase-like protein
MLDRAGLTIYLPYVGNFFTSLEMMGATLTLMEVDEDLKSPVDLDADSHGTRSVREVTDGRLSQQR